MRATGVHARPTRQDFLDYAVRMAVEEGDDFDLLAMGRPEGQGCYCAANHMLRDIMDGINRGYDWVVMDNEAGMEHLSRRTTRDVDHLLLVSDASVRGMVAAEAMLGLSKDLEINVRNTYLIVNRVQGEMSPACARRRRAWACRCSPRCPMTRSSWSMTARAGRWSTCLTPSSAGRSGGRGGS